MQKNFSKGCISLWGAEKTVGTAEAIGAVVEASVVVRRQPNNSKKIVISLFDNGALDQERLMRIIAKDSENFIGHGTVNRGAGQRTRINWEEKSRGAVSPLIRQTVSSAIEQTVLDLYRSAR